MWGSISSSWDLKVSRDVSRPMVGWVCCLDPVGMVVWQGCYAGNLTIFCERFPLYAPFLYYCYYTFSFWATLHRRVRILRAFSEELNCVNARVQTSWGHSRKLEDWERKLKFTHAVLVSLRKCSPRNSYRFLSRFSILPHSFKFITLNALLDVGVVSCISLVRGPSWRNKLWGNL